jgi:ornithine carbamoyltransferase
MSYRARSAVEAAMTAAASRGDTMVTPEHLLFGILKDEEGAAARALARLDASAAELREKVEPLLPRLGESRKVDREMELRNTTTDAIAQAELVARDAGDGQITTLRLLLALMLRPENPGAGVLRDAGVALKGIRTISEDFHKARARDRVVDPSELVDLTLSQLIVRGGMKGTSLLRVSDLYPADVATIFAVADRLKSRRHRGSHDDSSTLLAGKTLAMVFQKPSLRTRVTFEIAMTQLGGHAIHLGPDEIGVGEREAPADVARNLARWVDGIVARTFKHTMIEELVANAKIPVINGLSDLEHPCQALADLFTMRERFGALKGLTLAYVGDSNNVSRSLMELAARTGVNMRLAAPKGYHFDQAFLDEVKALGASNGAVIEAVIDPKEAAAGADALYTDVWASMGQESETATRKNAFEGYQLNAELLSLAKPTAIVLHCQPAHRGEEISSEAMDCPNSAVFDQAENRMHVQKALLALMM